MFLSYFVDPAGCGPALRAATHWQRSLANEENNSQHQQKK